MNNKLSIKLTCLTYTKEFLKKVDEFTETEKLNRGLELEEDIEIYPEDIKALRCKNRYNQYNLTIPDISLINYYMQFSEDPNVTLLVNMGGDQFIVKETPDEIDAKINGAEEELIEKKINQLMGTVKTIDDLKGASESLKKQVDQIKGDRAPEADVQ